MDLPISILILLGFVIVVSFLLKSFKSEQESTYEKLPVLLTPAERSFFGVLNNVVADYLVVFAKVRVADVLAPQKGMTRSNWQRAFNRISSKHFDFVLCEKDDLSIVCAIELNDKSHSNSQRQQRDKFLREICESANLPLIEFTARKSYRTDEMRDALLLHLKNADSAQGEASRLEVSE